MRKSVLLSTFCLLSICFSAKAQIKATTEKGDTILVFENGTWSHLKKETKPVANIVSNVKATVTVDEFTNKKSVQTEIWHRFGQDKLKNTISGYLRKIDNLTVFLISYSGDVGCLSKHSSTLKVKLSNGDIIEFSQISDTDCGKSPSANFIPLTKDQLNTPSYNDILIENIELLKKYDWETIRLQGSKYYTDIMPFTTRGVDKPEQFFRQHIIASESN
jgi:hypothetical protein